MPTPGKLHLQNLHFDKHNLAEMCENPENGKSLHYSSFIRNKTWVKAL